jgi:small subunit ribosomal protein S16
MLAIRMQRNGRSGLPVYRIVVQEAQRHPLSGRIVAQVGSYNPHTKATLLDREKVEFYLTHGAQPSTRVARIFALEKIKLPSWVKPAPIKQSAAKRADKLRKNQPQTASTEAAAEPTPAPAPAPAAPIAADTTDTTPAAPTSA